MHVCGKHTNKEGLNMKQKVFSPMTIIYLPCPFRLCFYLARYNFLSYVDANSICLLSILHCFYSVMYTHKHIRYVAWGFALSHLPLIVLVSINFLLGFPFVQELSTHSGFNYGCLSDLHFSLEIPRCCVDGSHNMYNEK